MVAQVLQKRNSLLNIRMRNLSLNFGKILKLDLLIVIVIFVFILRENAMMMINAANILGEE